MPSTSSSTRAENGSINSHNNGSQSRSMTVSERSTSASKHSKTSKRSARTSSRKPSPSVSDPSDASFSKPNHRTSSTHSPKPSHRAKHGRNLTLAHIRGNNQANGKLKQKMSPVLEDYLACPIRPNFYNAYSTTTTTTTTTTTMIEAEYKARIQAHLDDLKPLLDVNGESADASDNPVDMYDSQLELDG